MTCCNASMVSRSSRLPSRLASSACTRLFSALIRLLAFFALAFVLARNVVKLVVERRKALPFARFRAKLVAVLLGQRGADGRVLHDDPSVPSGLLCHGR